MVVEKRLHNVYERFVDGMATKRTIVVKHVADNRSEEICFGRFLRNKRVRMEAILSEATLHLADAVADKELLLIEDTSEMSFGHHPPVKDLAPVGNGMEMGYFVHPVLALDAVHRSCYGLAACQLFKRSTALADQGLDVNARRAAWQKMPFEQKHTYRWLSSITEAKDRCALARRMTVVADREADIYEALAGFVHLDVDFVVRLKANRLVEGGTAKVLETLSQWAVKDSYDLELPATHKRSARTAHVQVKYGSLKLQRPKTGAHKGLPACLQVNIIEAKEASKTAGSGQEPVHWILITTHAVEDFEQVRQCLKWYSWRWYIEQLFRLLKTQGLDITHSELSAYHSLSNMTALALVAAVRVLQLLLSRDNAHEQGVATAFTKEQIVFLKALCATLQGRTEKLKNPYPEHTMAYAVWVIARLAGWSGYQKQSPPGPITLHRGMIRFYQLFEGFMIANTIFKNSS